MNEFREQRLRALEERREQLVVSVRTSLVGSELLVRQRFTELDAQCTDLGTLGHNCIPQNIFDCFY